MNIASNIPAPSMPVIGPDGRIAPVWFQFFMTLLTRTGGTQGVSSNDISVDISEDSGIEEVKAQLTSLRDVVAFAPSAAPLQASDDQAPAPTVAAPPDDPSGRIESLEAAVQRLQTEIEAIRQGQQL